MFFKIVRIFVPLFSLTLLAGYVVYSHVTPNTPPPDPLGLTEIESRQEPNASDFDGMVKTEHATSFSKRSRNDLRIISSKVINQPVFRLADRDRPKIMPEMRVATAGFKAPGFQMVRNLEVIPELGDSARLPFDSLLKRPADALEQPENIGRIMAAEGSYFSESRRVITVGNLAAVKRRDEYFRITGGRFAWYPPPPPRYPIDPMLWPLVKVILSLDEKDGNSLPWNKP